MKYKVGDKVRIKSLDWYNQMLSIPTKIVGKGDFVAIECGTHIFTKEMSKFCGRVMTIQDIGIDFYLMEEDNLGYEFTDEMIEGLVEEEVDLIPKFGEYSDNEPLDVPTMTTEFVKEYGLPCPDGYEFRDENGNVINAQKIVLEKKSPKTNAIIKWLKEHDMTKYIGVIYSGMCSITFDTEKFIKDITEIIGDE